MCSTRRVDDALSLQVPRVHLFALHLQFPCSGLEIQGVSDGELCGYTFLQRVSTPLQHFPFFLGPLHDRIVQPPLPPLLTGIPNLISVRVLDPGRSPCP
jgi:hypothetical protein